MILYTVFLFPHPQIGCIHNSYKRLVNGHRIDQQLVLAPSLKRGNDTILHFSVQKYADSGEEMTMIHVDRQDLLGEKCWRGGVFCDWGKSGFFDVQGLRWTCIYPPLYQSKAMMGVQSSKLPAFSPHLEQKEVPPAFCPIFEPWTTESGSQILRQASQQLL